ncbi:ribosomal protein S8 [Bimuria novae-zelandiae CBS 107.79]|uniref:Ribosomal protein S8 n=1 Tax=Bimuria novae-zelandiae CBS 107.79 TaxID=1447943 RepID=A0A6A5UWB7_9PLEO|nr:ribosomal protein S8 [Bimuria novae-zelandiae CBS 107.79]
MQRHGYIGAFEVVDDHRDEKVVVQLTGRLNKCGVISPRYNAQLNDLEEWVVKLLPSRQFGFVVLTTSAGIMDHTEARRKHVAGKILGFFYWSRERQLAEKLPITLGSGSRSQVHMAAMF